MKASEVLYYLVHPSELRAIIQWKVWHDAVHERNEEKESESLKRCFYFLDKTSRSFAAVIKELHPELLVPVCLFYLILRGLDTIEDDMTISLEEKEPILQNFDKHIETDGWSYSGNHAKEKDRDLLVEFPCVIKEFKEIKPAYRDIIRDITKRMGDGMAEYCNNAEHNKNGVETIAEYERYCHYVAGLVGEGLTRLFVEAKLANDVLLQRPDLHESMGQFLQQVNILRDIREDHEDNRRFWPKEIWSKYVDSFEDMFKPQYQEKAMYATSEMVLNALRKAPDVIFYLAGLREQSVFNFAAIPQSMAIATLDVCFHNPDILKKNVKITKGQACRLMLESTQNLQVLCVVFRTYARSIAKKNDPRDPNFIDISIACGKIEQFIETIFPSQKPGAAASSLKFANAAEEEKAKAIAQESKWDTIYMGLAVLAVLALVTGLMITAARFAGARFDIMFNQIFKKGMFIPPKGAEQTAAMKQAYGHGEL